MTARVFHLAQGPDNELANTPIVVCERRDEFGECALIPQLAEGGVPAMRTHSSESPSKVISCGTAVALSPGSMFVNSPIDHAALRRTTAFELSS